MLHSAGGNKFIENMLLLFLKKILFWGKWAILGPIWCKNDVFLQLQINSKNFFKILQNEKSQEVHES